MTETTTRARNTVFTGTLTDVMEITGIAGLPELIGTLRGTVKGKPVETRMRCDITQTEALRPIFKEGPIALYGELRPTGFIVKGPDLRNSTLQAAALAANDALPPRSPLQLRAMRVRAIRQRRAAVAA